MEQYIFSPTACESGLEEELAAALEKRTEVVSRASFPNMWKKTDALNRYAARGRTQNGIFRKILSWILILAGLFLAIPGMMEPEELRTPLVLGIFFVLLGLLSLLGRRLVRKDASFRRAAAKLLKTTSGLDAVSVQVVFNDEGMSIITQDDACSVPYADMEMLVETPRLYLLTHDGQATVLQKKDLTGEAEGFSAFLTARALSVYRTEEK